MLPEMILLKGLYDHNRKLWYRSFPFHFGLYLAAGFLGLLVLGAVLELAGVVFEGPAAQGGTVLLSGVTSLIGLSGLVLGIIGAVALLHARLTDEDLKPYTAFSHIFNLLFIAVTLALCLAAWVAADLSLAPFRTYIGSLITLDISASINSPILRATILAASLLIAYIPLTHMSHFFVKWFTWHKIRWDDEPNVRGGRFDVMIEKALKYPVSWSADHVNADGKKNWVDIATEEIKKS
jgi:nitrate reductase gamma subunit